MSKNNNLARRPTVLHSGSYSNSPTNLHELHWLPMRERILLKIANLCYRAVRVGQPLDLAVWKAELTFITYY